MAKDAIEEARAAKTSPEGDDEESQARSNMVLDALFEAKSDFKRVDKSGDSRLTRDELRSGMQDTNSQRPGSPELYLLKNFGQVSGGAGSISKPDIERAILVNLTAAIESAPSNAPLNFEIRSGITRLIDASSSRSDLQNQFNTALAGSGKQVRIDKASAFNYLMEQIPATGFTLGEGNSVVVDRFISVKTSHAQHSLFAGKSVEGGSTIIEGLNPYKSCDPSLQKSMSDLRALQHLMNDPLLLKKGEISLSDMTKYQSSTQEHKYTKYFLQFNFGKLAMQTGDVSTISKADLRKEMEGCVSSLIAKSVALNKKESGELVDTFIKSALQDEYVGLSKTFTETLNAALKKEGYSAAISTPSVKLRTATGEYIRTLSIKNESNPKQSQAINFLTRDPNLSYHGYEKGYVYPF